MTTATDHKNNLNRSVLKKDYARTLRVETIANSAGGTAQVSIVAQPSIGFLNTKYYSNGSPTEDTEDCLNDLAEAMKALDGKKSGQPWVPHGDSIIHRRSEQWLDVMRGNRGYPTLAA